MSGANGVNGVDVAGGTLPLTAFQRQQIALEKGLLLTELAAKQQVGRFHLSGQRRLLIVILALLFFILTKYSQLKIQYKPVFELFKTKQNYGCKNQNVGAWSIVMGFNYSWVGKFLFAQPLTEAEARFLYYVILNKKVLYNGVPNIAFICGNVCTAVNYPLGNCLNGIKNGNTDNPWVQVGILPTSKVITDPDPEGVSELMENGYVGYMKWVSKTTDSPEDIYNNLFLGHPNQTTSTDCDSTGVIIGAAASGASLGAIGVMLGGPVIGAAGLLAGLVMGGIGVVNSLSTSGCL